MLKITSNSFFLKDEISLIKKNCAEELCFSVIDGTFYSLGKFGKILMFFETKLQDGFYCFVDKKRTEFQEVEYWENKHTTKEKLSQVPINSNEWVFENCSFRGINFALSKIPAKLNPDDIVDISLSPFDNFNIYYSENPKFGILFKRRWSPKNIFIYIMPLFGEIDNHRKVKNWDNEELPISLIQSKEKDNAI